MPGTLGPDETGNPQIILEIPWGRSGGSEPPEVATLTFQPGRFTIGVRQLASGPGTARGRFASGLRTEEGPTLPSRLRPRPLSAGSSLTAEGQALTRLGELRDAAAAAFWAAGPSSAALELALISTAADDPGPDIPRRFDDLQAASSWCAANGWDGATVEALDSSDGVERPGFVAVSRRAGSETSRSAPADLRRDLARAVRLVSLETALQQERSMLTAVLENASDAIVAVDRDCRVVLENPAAIALLGRPDRAARLTCGEYFGCLGGTIAIQTTPAAAPAEATPADDLAASTGPGSAGVAWAIETRSAADAPHPIRCGSACPLHQVLSGVTPIIVRDETSIGLGQERIPVSATYVRTPGQEVGAVAIFRDLRAGRAIDELKSSFVAAVSHELRTPLALISGYSQSLLQLDLDEAARRQFLERIDGTTNRMRGLVDQLLDVTTMESDRLALDPRPISLRSLLKTIIDEAAEMPGSLGVSLSVPPDLPPVYADPIRIGQVVANLLDNARKYGAPASTISMRVQRVDDQAVVSVDNEGPEIAPEDRESVFERFYRGRDAKSSGTPGIGLGLYLCRRLVEAHGGQIGLEERPGGTCVWLTLPLAVEEHTRHGRGGQPADDRGIS